jgi:hypothetical protein
MQSKRMIYELFQTRGHVACELGLIENIISASQGGVHDP